MMQKKSGSCVHDDTAMRKERRRIRAWRVLESRSETFPYLKYDFREPDP